MYTGTETIRYLPTAVYTQTGNQTIPVRIRHVEHDDFLFGRSRLRRKIGIDTKAGH